LTVPVALVTGVGRAAGIGAAVADALAADGFTVATVGWRAYDAKMPWGADAQPMARFEADFSDPAVPDQLFGQVNAQLGSVSALVMCHCESVDSSIADTTVESFDRHFAVNARAPWLLIKAFAAQFAGPAGTGRIVAITSDAIVHNMPYGASKGALDRIVFAAAEELASLGLTANVVNPGPVDNGWMDDDLKVLLQARNLQPRLGRSVDCANLVRFLCSPEGQWINRQLLYSDGGLRSH
jgi:3-oxoacyl-[acyl-carrier protein] reductase